MWGISIFADFGPMGYKLCMLLHCDVFSNTFEYDFKGHTLIMLAQKGT